MILKQGLATITSMLFSGSETLKFCQRILRISNSLGWLSEMLTTIDQTFTVRQSFQMRKMEGKWAERVLSLGMTVGCLLTIYVMNHFLFQVNKFFYSV